ncbi:MAG: class I SAM-dependent methyltransferase [Roseobacter sp.]
MTDSPQAFWNRVARRYADMPMRNPDAYDTTLALLRTYLQPASSVLELGCGTGTTARHLARHVGHYTATDYAPEMIAIAQEKHDVDELENLTFQTGAVGDGSLPPGPFDVILAFNFLHLLPNRQTALTEIFEILPSGGLFIAKTPCLGGVFRALQPLVTILRWAGKAPDVRFLTPSRLERDIRAAGFEIIKTGDYPKRPPSRLIFARKA